MPGILDDDADDVFKGPFGAFARKVELVVLADDQKRIDFLAGDEGRTCGTVAAAGSGRHGFHDFRVGWNGRDTAKLAAPFGKDDLQELFLRTLGHGHDAALQGLLVSGLDRPSQVAHAGEFNVRVR